MVYLNPVLPILTLQAARFLNTPLNGWADELKPLLHHKINHFEPLLTRIEPDKITAILNASQEHLMKN